jgi:WD40 repeat protein
LVAAPLRYVTYLVAGVMLVIMTAGAIAGPAPDPAQDPWLRINAGGHTASVRALAFTPDSTRLCSAGLDKAVQVWNLTAIARDLRRTFLRERTIRWQVARGLRGSIYALASSPNDALLALGGYGAMGSLGEILLVNPVEGNLVKVLQGHRQTVCSLAFSADGNWLASSDAGGQAVVWRRGEWQPRTLYEPDSKTYDAQLAQLIQQQPKLRPIAILGNQEVVVPACIGRQPDVGRIGNPSYARLGWKLQQIGMANPAAFRTLETVHQGMVSALAATRDGALLASADLAGKLYLWDLKAGTPPAELDAQGTVLSLSFSPDGRTLAAGTAVDPARKTSQLQMWDVASRSMKRSRPLPDHVQTCIVSPDGKDVAYAGGKDNEVFVEALDAPQQTVALHGTGRRIFKVAFARGDPPYRIAFGTLPRERGFNDYADLDESFDPVGLELGVPGALDPAEWLAPDWCRGNWTAQRQPDGGLQTYRDGVAQGRVVLDPSFEGRVRSYCWIADAKGETFAIAVGTDLQNSVYVLRLVAEGRCPVLRHFRGHHDFVTSVAVSRDLRYLASASADGTVMFWSLASIERGAEVPGRWGADFAAQGEELAAANVHPAGTLWGKGVRSGDLVREIRWNDGKAVHSENRPASIREQLQGLPWGTQVTFEYLRQGVRQPPFQLLPAWQPLATLFVSTERQWAFWTPQGYYDASINGYTLFGWQVNRGLDALPDFYRADQFRKKLERPDIMEQLLPAGSLEQAFEAARQKPPAQSQRILPDHISATPRLEIVSPRSGQLVAGNATTVRARIVMPAAGNLVETKVFANGVSAVGQRLVRERQLPAARELTYDWDVRLPADPKNLIQVVVGTDAPTAALGDILIERPPGVRPDRQSRLWILAVGIDKYADPAIQRLSFAVADAESITKTLQQRSKGWYTVDKAVVLKNEQATPQQWQKALQDVGKDLKQRARPDDLLVLFFAGHGIVDSETKRYYFVGHEFKVEDLEKRQYAACISWKDFQLLAGIPCRRLVLLDTCHAGAIQTLRSQNLKAAVRDLQDDVIFTFAASAGNEKSAENKVWQHGAFTQSLLEALRGEAPGLRAPVITLNEAVTYVQSAVRKLTKDRQNPMAAPDEILPFTSLILAGREGSSLEKGTGSAADPTKRP